MSPRLPRPLRELVPAGDPDLDRYLRWSGSAAALVTALWLWLQLDLLDQRVFGNFYDIQARALLAGDLAVPDGALGNEAFAVRGHEFLYNPPGPSFLRMPVLVVTDRFAGSSLAYQSYGRGLPLDEVEHLSRWATDGVWPDLVVLLDVPEAVADERLGAERDRMEGVGDGFHGRVVAGFRALAAADPERWVVLDGTGTVDEVAERVWTAVAPHVPVVDR